MQIKKKMFAIAISLTVLLAFSALLQQTKSASTGLVGYWKFDEGSGIVASDSSGNGNTGTIHGAQWVDGKVGKALKFNGVNNYVSVPNSPSLDISGNEISVEYWINLPNGWYADSTQGNQIIFDKGDAYTAAMIGSTGCLCFNIPYVQPYPETNKNSWNPNTWYHIANVFDGSQIRIYVNGVLDKTAAVVGSVSRSSINLAIGSHCYGDKNFINAIIDEFAIYNYARTSEQIMNDYALIATPTSTPTPSPSPAPSPTPTPTPTPSPTPTPTQQPATPETPFWMQWWFLTIVSLGLSIIAVLVAFTALHNQKKAAKLRENKAAASLATSIKYIVCPNCGANLPADSKFCGKCGTTLQ